MTARAHFGRSKSGKSHLFKRFVEQRAQQGGSTIVFDRIHEWVDRDGHTELACDVAVASTDEGLQRWLSERPTATLVFKPPDIFAASNADPMKTSDDLTRTASVLAREALRTQAVFVSAEAHRVARNGAPLPALLDELAGAGRHYGAEWWCDTQAFSLLSTRVRRQATEVRIFSMVEPQELASLQRAYGREMVEAVRECTRRMGAGEPGWFVNVDPMHAEPPWFIGRWEDGRIRFECIEEARASDSEDKETSPQTPTAKARDMARTPESESGGEGTRDASEHGPEVD